MSKCGSSALQQAMSFSPVIRKKDGGQFVYAALHSSGLLSHGDALAQQAKIMPQSYVSSATWKELSEMGLAKTLFLKTALARLCAPRKTVILSNEGWGGRFAVFQEGKILEKLDLNCHVVLYVRPQIEWLNSAWWQWGAWSEVPMQQWAIKRRMLWHRLVEEWRNTPGVRKVTVRVLPRDIVADFSNVIGAVPFGDGALANASLPGSVLRVFQRHRHLRPDEHSSTIEFVLSRHLSLPKRKTPWVLPQKLVSTIISRCEESNRILLDYLEGDQKSLMQDNPAWWSADYYADRKVEPARAVKPVAEELDELAAASFKALLELDLQYRKLLSAQSGPWWRRLPGWGRR